MSRETNNKNGLGFVHMEVVMGLMLDELNRVYHKMLLAYIALRPKSQL